MKETNGMAITRTCKEENCKKEFTISVEEAKWLKEHELELFKRCPECRKRRREEKKKEEGAKVEALANA